MAGSKRPIRVIKENPFDLMREDFLRTLKELTADLVSPIVLPWHNDLPFPEIETDLHKLIYGDFYYDGK